MAGEAEEVVEEADSEETTLMERDLRVSRKENTRDPTEEIMQREKRTANIRDLTEETMERVRKMESREDHIREIMARKVKEKKMVNNKDLIEETMVKEASIEDVVDMQMECSLGTTRRTQMMILKSSERKIMEAISKGVDTRMSMAIIEVV